MGSVELKSGNVATVSGAATARASDWKTPVFCGFLLILATVAVYARVHTYGFVNYDDTVYVTQNPHVQDGLTWDTVRWAFTTYSVGTWHPLTWLSHALDSQLFDVDASGPHCVNLLLHLLNVAALFWVLLRATGRLGCSFMVAALFALHPINVESVVWIAERKNCLSLLFFLLALGAYRWYSEKPKPGRYSLVAVLFALGLMAKPQVITFPFVLLLWDYWPLRRMSLTPSEAGGGSKFSFLQLAWEKLPLLALAGVSATITMAAQRADGNKAWYPVSLRVEYALVSYVQYLSKALWPFRLSPFYPHPDSVKLAHAAEAAMLLAIISVVVIALRRSHSYLLVGWFWFLGTLVPMLGLEGVGYQGKQGIADRYAYLPFIGLFILVSWGIAELADRKPVPVAVVRCACAALLLALGVMAYRQLGYWQDNVTLWTHAIEVTQGNFLAENNLGRALLNEGRVQEGVAHFYKAAGIYPDDPIANLNIGIYEQKQGNYSEAIERYKTTLSVTRDRELRVAALKSTAACYRQLGDFAAAQQSLDAAAQLQRGF